MVPPSPGPRIPRTPPSSFWWGGSRAGEEHLERNRHPRKESFFVGFSTPHLREKPLVSMTDKRPPASTPTSSKRSKSTEGSDEPPGPRAYRRITPLQVPSQIPEKRGECLQKHYAVTVPTVKSITRRERGVGGRLPSHRHGRRRKKLHPKR